MKDNINIAIIASNECDPFAGMTLTSIFENIVTV